MTSDAAELLARRAAGQRYGIEPGASSFFAKPTGDFDPAIIDNASGAVRPDVREWLLSRLYGFWAARYHAPRHWSTVWIAGSGLTHQWSASRSVDEPGDLDVLIGVDFPRFYAANPRFRQIPEEALAERFNDEFRAGLDVETERTHFPLNSYPWAEVSTRGGFPTTRVATTSSSTQTGPASRPSPVGMGALHTPSKPTFSDTESSSGKDWVDRRLRSVASAGNGHRLPVDSAINAARPTIASGTSSVSTASPAISTTRSLRSRTEPAGSAAGQIQAVPDGSTSTTSTTRGKSAVFSATPVITASGSSETLSKGSNESSTIFGADPVYTVTFYVNPGAADIRTIRPYAAFDLTHNAWTVRPPEIGSDWDPRTSLPPDWFASFGRETETARGIVGEVNRHIGELRPLRPGTPDFVNSATLLHDAVRRGADLFDAIHTDRHKAFGPEGSGYADFYNVRWQTHKQDGTVAVLHRLKDLWTAAHKDATERCGGPILDARHALTLASLVGSW